MKSRHYAHVVGFALDHPWAITRPMLSLIAGVLARHIAGEEVDRAAIEAALVNRKNLPQPTAGSIAVIPVYGVLAPRMNLMSEMSGGTTYDKLSGQLRQAVGDKAIKTIVLDIDSPGGSVAGMSELAREIMSARTRKPVIAQIQYTGASAAYGLASAATEIIAAPSAMVGSVGVYTAHDDLSAALAQMGIKRTYISAGEGKVLGNETEPLPEVALERITARVEAVYTRFVGDVVKGRGQGVTTEQVRKEWKALTYGAEEAKAIGMIDRIATLDETLQRVLSTSADPADQRAARALLSPTEDTPQEPSPATGQDPRSDAHWQNAMDRELLNLAL